MSEKVIIEAVETRTIEIPIAKYRHQFDAYNKVREINNLNQGYYKDTREVKLEGKQLDAYVKDYDDVSVVYNVIEVDKESIESLTIIIEMDRKSVKSLTVGKSKTVEEILIELEDNLVVID